MKIDFDKRLNIAQKKHVTHPHDLAHLQEICECLTALHRQEEMLPWAESALVINPHDPAFMTHKADALYLLGQYAEAACVWEIHPSRTQRPALQRLRLGMSVMMMGDLQRAIALLSKGLTVATSQDTELISSLEFALGEAMLKAGNHSGFEYWLMRNDVLHLSSCYRPLSIPPWDGERDLNGKRILVTHEMGFGDQFLLTSLIHDWLNAGAQIMLTCHSWLHTLLQASLPRCEIVITASPVSMHSDLPSDLQEAVVKFAPHMHITLLHLPLLRTHQAVSNVPWFRPWIQAPLHKSQIARKWAQQLRAQFPEKKLVGLFWDCTQRHWPEMGAVVRCWATRRSLTPTAVRTLVQHPTVDSCVHFVNLHHPAAARLAGAPSNNISDYQPGIVDFSDTAACIAHLDAVVAVDSSVANLAVMMGVMTCVATHISGDWRWGLTGNKSPWIKNVTVYRQIDEGDWDPVIDDIICWLTEAAIH